ncbi:transporter [Lysobacteraceae bacterium NML120232]|nr:transporter [Xanthomonadaceae bacterium NML08-0793]PJK11681.1 transporter [Xanthomonadaceae bacterium NML120232]
MAKFHGLTLALLTALSTAGCATLVPDTPAPETGIPAQWQIPPDRQTGDARTLDWRGVVQDARLQRVLEQTLANNRDLRVAALNVERARAQYRITRANRLPVLGGNLTQTRSGGDAPVSESYSASLGLASFELDLFGRMRNLSEAAVQQFFAQEENRRATQLSLLAETGRAWLTLAADQSLLAIAEDTLQAYQETLRLTERRHELGAVSGLEIAQMRAQVETARGDVARYAAQVQLDRNALDLLVGMQVAEADLPQGMRDEEIALTPLPAGVASDVLLRRPDIRAAEHALLAASANIGAARAAFFPSISLTASAGTASSDFSGLFDAGTRFWRFVPQINIPIFQGGALRANLKVAEANRDIALASYEKAIQTGFREVADALVQEQALSTRRAAAENLLQAARQAEQLSSARRDAGRDSYLTLLDTQRTRYAAEQAAIAIRLAQQANRVTLYQVLGGGVEAENAQ